MRCTARSAAAAREQAQLAPTRRRTLVAMSGGVDSAVAALLVAETAHEAVGVTLELWSDPENDGELSCCSAQAVRGARALAHGLGMPHLSIDLRAEFRAGVVDGWLADHAAGLTPNPCVRCNGNVRLDAMLELAERLGARDARHRPLRARVDEARRCCGWPPTSAKDQSYVLSALAPDSLARLRFPLGELHKARGARARRRRPGWPSRASATRRISASSPAPASGAFLERHGGLGAHARPDRRRARGACSASTRGAHVYTVGQRHGLGIGARAAAVRARAPTPRANTVTVGPRGALLAQRVPVRELTLHRERRRVDGVRVRSHGRRLPAALARRPRRRAPRAREHRAGASPPSAPRPARSPACTPATWSSATAPSPLARALRARSLRSLAR